MHSFAKWGILLYIVLGRLRILPQPPWSDVALSCSSLNFYRTVFCLSIRCDSQKFSNQKKIRNRGGRLVFAGDHRVECFEGVFYRTTKDLPAELFRLRNFATICVSVRVSGIFFIFLQLNGVRIFKGIFYVFSRSRIQIIVLFAHSSTRK